MHIEVKLINGANYKRRPEKRKEKGDLRCAASGCGRRSNEVEIPVFSDPHSRNSPPWLLLAY
eukprot:11470.XXX_466765_466950_1 [CDS] Oithona nana genome sequencing.